MKKILFLLFAALLLVCCTERLSVEEVPDSPTDGHYVPIGQALDELDGFLSALNVATRAEGVTRRYSDGNVTTVCSEDVFVGTRSDAVGGDVPAEMLYIVNFDDGLGGAVLSADDRVSDIVLCVTESGSFSVSDFVAAGELLLSEGTGGVSVRSDGSADDDDEDGDGDDDDDFEDLGELTVPTILLASFLKAAVSDDTMPAVGGDPDSLLDDWPGRGTGGSGGSGGGSSGSSGSGDCSDGSDDSSYTATKYGPYTTTKWGQTRVNGDMVFNRYTPNNAPAGCVVIAVAQILLATLPESTIFTNNVYPCVFGTMLTVADYAAPDDAGTEIAQIQAGQFVYGLGQNRLLCHVKYGDKEDDETSGTAKGAKRTLKAFLYSDVKKRMGFGNKNQSRATEQIRKGLPVYLSGCHSWSLHGHAWVLDGEWGDYYHINWGWNGTCDGYFSKGVFKTTDRYSTDEIIDEKSGDGIDNKYTWVYRMVTYSK